MKNILFNDADYVLKRKNPIVFSDRVLNLSSRAAIKLNSP